MNDDTNLIKPSSRQPNERPLTQRPPINWPIHRASPSENRTTDFARKQVERSYVNAPTVHHAQTSPNNINSESSHTQHTLRNTSVDASQYHQAWQQYYHQYFYQYYANWWRQQPHSQATVNNATHTDTKLNEHEIINKNLKAKIRATAKKQAQRVKSSNHYKPALASISVGLFFLLINYNQVLVGAVKQYVSPGSVVTTPVIVESSASAMVGPEPKIIIPKIGVEAPVVYDEPNIDEASYQKALERGVVRLGNSADPGTNGNVVIGGHSSNNIFNAGGFKYVFVNLKQLDVGDVFYLNYNSKRYTYKVTVAKKIITPQETSVLAQTSTPTITLFTCDPPGTNVNRLIVQATQIDPSPSSATKVSNKTIEVNPENPLPSVAPSMWDWLLRRDKN